MLIFLFAAIAAVLAFLAFRLRKKLQKVQASLDKTRQKYEPIINVEQYIFDQKKQVEEYVNNQRNQIDNYVSEQRLELQARETEANAIYNDLEEQITVIKSQYQNAKEEVDQIDTQLELAKEDAFLMNCGYYEPSYGDMNEESEWGRELKKVNEKIKEMLDYVKYANDKYADKTSAGYIQKVVTFNDSEEEGVKMQISTIKLLLRAFNGECDAFVAKVSYRNISTMQKRIQSSYDAICKIGEKSNFVSLNDRYKDLKMKELGLVYEYQAWKQREKEEQAQIREQMREEQKAAKELEKAQKEAEKEAQRNAAALLKARSEVEGANEAQKEKLFKQIKELENRMQEMEEKNRYISQAMLTKSGHVYIISNVGSFGDKILKIGMTRRLEPMERVKELGDASVPFPFDVHAMIRTSDAPTLENALHKHFEERRVNLENTRKEFFYISLDEIKQELDILKDELNIEAEIFITMAAEAREWRMSEAKRAHMENMLKQS